MGKKKHFIHAIFLGLISICTLIGASGGVICVSADDSGNGGAVNA